MLTIDAGSARAAGGGSIGSDKSQIAQLEQEIEQQGILVQTLVDKSDEVQAKLQIVQDRITVEKSEMAIEQQTFAAAHTKLGQVAIEAYAAGGSFSVDWSSSSSVTASAEQGVYANVADSVLANALNAVQLAERQLTITSVKLQADEQSLTATLQQLSVAKQQAQSAINRDEQILSTVKGNLRQLVIAAAVRAEEIQRAQEEAAAEAAAQAAAAAAAAAAAQAAAAAAAAAAAQRQKQQQQQQGGGGSTAPPGNGGGGNGGNGGGGNGGGGGGGGYADPLRAISALSPERIDMGVDYSGYGPIYAIGDGVVVNTVNGGWPGGTFIVYQLTDGPAQGLYAYAAEDINPEVSVGQDVTAGTVLGQMYEGPDGIETGWADGNALGDTMAATAGQFYGSNSTAFGANFSGLLAAVGAPPGILQNNPPTGYLPGGWPQW